MENIPLEILNRDIHHLDISLSLRQMLELNHLNTLKELLEQPMHEWFLFTGFSQHLLNELMNYLDQRTLLPYVKD